MMLTGAQILVQSLIDQGVEVIFGYPGGAVLNIYDALYDKQEEIKHILVSHEQGGAHAADGYARSTGKTGVVLATSGPGATNLVTGIATAYQDSVPMVAITGNVTTDCIGRDSFQEVDIVGISNPIVKHNFIVRDINKLAETVQQAFEIANSGRKGPVLIDIPKDITAAKTEYTKLAPFSIRPLPELDGEEMNRAIDAIKNSERPLIYIGGGITFTDSSAALLEFAEKIDAPIVSSLTGLSAVPADHDQYLGLVGMHGNGTANHAVLKCDLLIVAGARFSDRVAGNRDQFASHATIIHLDIDRSEISKNVTADIPLVGDAGQCLTELSRLSEQKNNEEWRTKLKEYQAEHHMPTTKSENGILNPREIVVKLREVMGEDGIVATDVGQHQMFVAQYYRFAKPRSFVSSCGLGTMGYGMGAANGVKVGNPDRPVALVTGDGSFHMNLSEFAVAVSNNLPIVVLVFNNKILGMVHQWQNLFYADRYSYTDIDRKTDFVKLAEAFGGVGFRIKTSEEIVPVLKEAFACGKPCIVDCVLNDQYNVYPIIPPGRNGEDIILDK